jgi:GNAT superfamily N-acetyltransferase
MSSPVTLTSTVGVPKDHLKYGFCREWLKPIKVRATVCPDLSKAPEEVGDAFGFIIRREAIRQIFHKSMEPPHEETMDLALTLFDRYGRLNKEVVEHPIRKGSGVWKEEVDKGNIVLIENVNVDRKWRRKGIGTKIVLHLLEKALASRHNPKFAFTRPAPFYDETKKEEMQGQTQERNRAFHRSQVAAVVSFFRSMQFRRVGITEWFALAQDEKHPSRQLPWTEDSDPVLDDPSDSDSGDEREEVLWCMPLKQDGTSLEFTQTRHSKRNLALQGFESFFKTNGATKEEVSDTSAMILKRRYPLHYAIKVLADKQCLDFLLSHASDNSAESFDIEAVNGHGDTVLHVAAKASKPACLSWVMDSPSGLKLLSLRNHEGYTPLEALKAQLECARISEPHGFSRKKCIADKFDGFDDDSVACLLQLVKLEAPTAEQRDMAKFGCSCGQCVAGYLSPRMIKKLHDEAAMLYDLSIDLDSAVDGETWYLAFKHTLIHLPNKLQPHFRRNTILRKVFTRLIGAIAKCLADKVIPHKASVVNALRETSIWSQIDGHYFQKGGTVAAAMNIVIDKAKRHDAEAKLPSFEVEIDDSLSKLPVCRNDNEFEFVRRHCTTPRTDLEGSKFP